MKRIGLLFLSIMLLIGNVAAQDVMVVTKKDGTKTTFNINSVQDISFINSEDINISISEIVPTSTISFLVKYSIATVGKINECGICYGQDETANANKITGTIENGEGSVEIDGKDYNMKYYLRAYANIDGELYYSDIIQYTTSTEFPVAEMVDLGLSVKWASHNLGAVNEESTGSHLPWGDVTGDAYNYSTYPSNLNITLSNISGTKYDIATHQWGENWRIPTHKEFEELWNNTTKEFINEYGNEKINAIKFTASNGNFIILPLAGYIENNKLYSSNYGHYWTADLSTDAAKEATTYVFVSAKSTNTSSSLPWNRLLIRPVYGEITDSGVESDEHEYVDLGLSRLWATSNYGANTPTEIGMYLAWGEETAKETYTPDTYSLYNDNNDKSIAFLINEKKDVVANNWGGKWKMPTYAEFKELIDFCTWTWTTENDVNGYRVEGTNGNSIFLPVSGNIIQNTKYKKTTDGYYWSGQSYTTDWGYCLMFNKSQPAVGGERKYSGCVIRPVRER